MALELVAIWTVVVAAIVWFFRSEKRLQRDRLDRQARHYATAPAYRHIATADTEESRRRLIEAMGKAR